MHRQAWEDWGSVDPLYAVLTAPQYRHRGGDQDEFFKTGEEFVAFFLGECDRLGLAQQPGRALDFGCGVGRVTAPLGARFDAVTGLDVAASMVDTARKLHADRPSAHDGDSAGTRPDPAVWPPDGQHERREMTMNVSGLSVADFAAQSVAGDWIAL